MTKIAIIGCKRIQDQLCVACEKCFKAISKNCKPVLKRGLTSLYKNV